MTTEWNLVADHLGISLYSCLLDTIVRTCNIELYVRFVLLFLVLCRPNSVMS